MRKQFVIVRATLEPRGKREAARTLDYAIGQSEIGSTLENARLKLEAAFPSWNVTRLRALTTVIDIESV